MLSDSNPVVEEKGGDDKQDASPKTELLKENSRKVLPALQDGVQAHSTASRIVDRENIVQKSSVGYGTYFLEYALLAEYNMLQTQKVGGVYVMPSAATPLVWFGVVFVRRGLYEGGVFRFKMNIPHDFPDGQVPTVVFESQVFHPLVDPITGELEVKKCFANQWRRNVHHLWHVLLYLRRIFYIVETTNPLNSEAAVLHDSNMDLFTHRVRLCVEKSINNCFDPPPTEDAHAFKFSQYDPVVHDPVRNELKSKGKCVSPENTKTGTSWLEENTMNILSKK